MEAFERIVNAGDRSCDFGQIGDDAAISASEVEHDIARIDFAENIINFRSEVLPDARGGDIVDALESLSGEFFGVIGGHGLLSVPFG